MKRTKRLLQIIVAAVLAVALSLSFTACTGGNPSGGNSSVNPSAGGNPSGGNGGTTSEVSDASAAKSDDDSNYTYAEDLVSDFTVTYGKGTEIGYEQEVKDGYTTITFGGQITADTVYSISGTLNGNVVIDVDETETYKFELELTGFTVQSEVEAPIVCLSGDAFKLTAKKNTENFVYDNRPAVDEDDDTQYSACIYSTVDTTVGGKGSLWVKSENNNGIHTKDDLDVKNLTLYVECVDNALKGNDSVNVTSGTLTLIATGGDGIKTKNSDVSSKGNQRGTVSLVLEDGDADVNIYAACDGIDAAYNVEIDELTNNLSLNVYTDKYSSYSGEVTDVASGTLYVAYSATTYKYSLYFYNNESDGLWVNSGSYTYKNGYYYYPFEKPSGYTSVKLYVYSSSQAQGQSTSYVKAVSGNINSNYDTLAIQNRGGNMSVGWTNYGTVSMGMGHGGQNEGNSDKGSYSTKGIKADNAIIVTSGTINVTSYDDALHVNMDNELENGETPLGNLNIAGGTLTLFSNDDALHADNTLTISGGTVVVTKAYEGLEANHIAISGGDVTVYATDDGVNASDKINETPTIVISGGRLDVTMGSGDVDGIDSNGSYTQTGGVVITRGAPNSNSNMSTGLDCDGTAKITGGTLVFMGSPETTPSKGTGVYQLSFGSAGGRGNSTAFAAGSWTLSGLDIEFKLTGTYYGCYVYSSELTKGTAYTVSCGSTSYTATAA